MNILILAENLEVNLTSSGLRSNKNILMYSKISKVDVITTTHLSYFKKINSVNYEFFKIKSTKTDALLSKIPKSSAIQNLLWGVSFGMQNKIKAWEDKVLKACKANKYEMVISLGSGGSFIPAYAMQRVKKRIAVKHMMFVHDPYPFNQYPPPYQQKNSLPYQSVAKYFTKVLDSADVLSFPSLRLKEWMQQYYSFIDNKYIIQPHIGLTINELEYILPEQGEESLPLYPRGLNIVHTGTLLGPRTPMFLLKALELLYKNYPESKSEVFLHIVGKMTKDWNAKELIRENVFVYPKRYSYLSSLNLQQNAQVLLLLEANAEVSPFMPGKLADYLIAKKPILALTPKSSETTRILGEDYPLLTENGDIERIYEKLLLLYEYYKNDTLQNLIPSLKSYKHVLPENWHKSLNTILNK